MRTSHSLPEVSPCIGSSQRTFDASTTTAGLYHLPSREGMISPTGSRAPPSLVKSDLTVVSKPTKERRETMGLNIRGIRAQRRVERPIDPLEIFRQLTVADQNINDLWLAQGDALRAWHENREMDDIGVVLNTGAGKTLVGLLVAQSLVNETRGKVLYACSSIQLVEQTAEKATGYGLDVATYYRGEFSNDGFLRGETACVTTYQAIFNGKSRLKNQ